MLKDYTSLKIFICIRYIRLKTPKTGCLRSQLLLRIMTTVLTFHWTKVYLKDDVSDLSVGSFLG